MAVIKVGDDSELVCNVSVHMIVNWFVMFLSMFIAYDL